MFQLGVASYYRMLLCFPRIRFPDGRIGGWILRLDTQGCVLVELFSLSGCQSRIKVYAMCHRGDIWCMLNMSKVDLPPSFYRDREEKLSLILGIRSCKDMETPEYLLG